MYTVCTGALSHQSFAFFSLSFFCSVSASEERKKRAVLKINLTLNQSREKSERERASDGGR